jgi:hypothetical protein
MLTTVVDFRTHGCQVKITRRPNGTISDNPAELGYFGNPFTVQQYSRERCIELYREYFAERMLNDPVFRTAVMLLKGKVLGCFCKPLACHGDVIADYLNSLEI